MNYHSSSSCVFYVAPLLLTFKEKTFITFQFAHQMTQKSINLVKERKNIKNIFITFQFAHQMTQKSINLVKERKKYIKKSLVIDTHSLMNNFTLVVS
jgi:hypothetical protein